MLLGVTERNNNALNIIIPSMPGPSTWSLSIRFPHQNPVYTSTLSIRATCPAHLILLNLITRTILGREYLSLSSSLCSFFPIPCYLVPLRPKYSPQHPVLKYPQPTFLLSVSDQVSHPYKTTGKIIVLSCNVFRKNYIRKSSTPLRNTKSLSRRSSLSKFHTV